MAGWWDGGCQWELRRDSYQDNYSKCVCGQLFISASISKEARKFTESISYRVHTEQRSGGVKFQSPSLEKLHGKSLVWLDAGQS